jgi:hypothetical protein
MPERFDLASKIVCAALAALLLYEFTRLVSRWNPLGNARIPALPTLSASPDGESGRKATNSVSTQAPKSAKAETNSVSPKSGKPETNVVASTNPGATATNPLATKTPEGARSGPMPRQAMAGKGPDLPPAIQARVDRIAQSELIAPFIRPLPMALLGLAGDSAFLRAANGQTGVIKEGAELGGLKLVRIGTNRVLVEQDGLQKELIIFSGYGGESLLPKTTPQPQ